MHSERIARIATFVLVNALSIGASELASATPGKGLTSTLLGKGTSVTGIQVDSRGPTDVTVREIILAPGGSTGWHHHPAEVVAVVKSGTLTRTLHDCSTEVTSAGGVVTEPGGPGDVHIGRNLGNGPVVLLVLYVLPAGRPLSEDAPAPPHCETGTTKLPSIR